MSKGKYNHIDGIGYVPDQLYVVWWSSKNDIRYSHNPTKHPAWKGLLEPSCC